MSIAVAQLGARMHYAVPRILHAAGLLERLYTDSYAGNKPWLRSILQSMPNWVRPSSATRWLARVEPALPARRVVSFESLGWHYWWLQKRAHRSAEQRALHAQIGCQFATRVTQRLPPDVRIAWGFKSAALELFDAIRERGGVCILEQMSSPHAKERSLLKAELERWRGWEPNLVLPPEFDRLAERECKEWELADTIIAGSKFVADGLVEMGVPQERCRVVPYGISEDRFTLARKSGDGHSSGPLRVLFVGGVRLLKGVPYLLEALRSLGPSRATCKLAGQVCLAADKLTPYTDVAEFLGIIPRQHLTELYNWADVFCLPTICEGSATVVYEAIQAGLPVITTHNAGSIIRDNSEGKLVPIRDAKALRFALEEYIDNPYLLRVHGANVAKARERASLQAYGKRLLEAVNLDR